MSKRLDTPPIDQLIHERSLDSAEELNALIGFEVADLMVKKDPGDQAFIFGVLSPEVAADVYQYLPVSTQKMLLEEMPSGVIAKMLVAMLPDDRTALLEKLPAPIVDEYIQLLPSEERTVALTLLGYPEGSTGRFMTTDYIAVKPAWTVEKTLEYIREQGHINDNINEIYVVDESNVLVDDIDIKQLFFAPKSATMSQIGDQTFASLSVLDNLQKAIEIFKQRRRMALPVIDRNGTLLGVVTIDDILKLASRRNTAEIQKIGGVEALDEPYMSIPFFKLMKKRARWLTILFLGEMLTTTAMAFFEDEISKAVVLALFLPLIISSGGNAGSQSSTLIIRAMALGEIKLKQWWSIFKKEILFGLSLGFILGAVGFARVSIWSSVSNIYGEHWFLVALTIFCSLIGVVAWGSLMGSMLPLLLKRCHFDPAVSSNPLVATLVDVTGIVIYFVVAMLILKGTLL